MPTLQLSEIETARAVVHGHMVPTPAIHCFRATSALFVPREFGSRTIMG